MLAYSSSVIPFTARVDAVINFEKIWVAALHDEQHGQPNADDESQPAKKRCYNPKQQLHGSNETKISDGWRGDTWLRAEGGIS